MGFCAIRGATTVINNEKDEILMATEKLLVEIINKNDVKIEDIISITFTCTKDLTKVYPAVSARNIGIVNASLMCCQELFVEGSLEKCIRISLMLNSSRLQSEMKHIYLNEAKKLRPDLVLTEG